MGADVLEWVDVVEWVGVCDLVSGLVGGQVDG